MYFLHHFASSTEARASCPCLGGVEAAHVPKKYTEMCCDYSIMLPQDSWIGCEKWAFHYRVFSKFYLHLQEKLTTFHKDTTVECFLCFYASDIIRLQVTKSDPTAALRRIILLDTTLIKRLFYKTEQLVTRPSPIQSVGYFGRTITPPATIFPTKLQEAELCWFGSKT